MTHFVGQFDVSRLADMVRRLALALEIRPHQQFAEQSGRKELHAPDFEQDAEQKQRVARHIVTAEYLHRGRGRQREQSRTCLLYTSPSPRD